MISNSHSVGADPSRAMQYYVNGGGQSYEQNDTRVDGASIKDMWERDILALVPTLEAVDSVNVSASNFEADTGFVGGASTRVQSKSGTNALHGALFEGYSGNKLETPAVLPARRPDAGENRIPRVRRGRRRQDHQGQIVLVRRL